MKRLLVAMLLMAGCARDHGRVLELTVESSCQNPTARISLVRFTVEATPPVDRPIFDVPATTLFDNGGFHRITLLLPERTARVKVTAAAFDGASTMIGGGMTTDDIFFNNPGFRRATIVISEPGCAMPLDLAARDLAGPTGDLAGADLKSPIIGTAAQGAFPAAVYEGEGSQLANAVGGVAVMITGTGFKPGLTLTTDPGYELGPWYVSPSGNNIATSIKLRVEPTLMIGFTRQVHIYVEQDGVSYPTEFQIQGLNELDVLPQTTTTLQTLPGAPIMYSSALVRGTLQLTGTNLSFFWVTGLLSGGGTVQAAPTTGGKPGCMLVMCDDRSGAGHGHNADPIAIVNAGGGASYGTSGMQGSGNGGAAGVPYGDATLIGLAGGSGGGSGAPIDAIGGRGGGVLRVWAGKILDVSLRADGEDGKQTQGGPGGGGGGGGSGGALLVHSTGGLSGTSTHALSAVGGSGGPGVGGLSYTGGDGGGGRTRIDVAIPFGPSFYSATPQIGVVGAMIAADWPSAWSSSPGAVKVICGVDSTFTVEVDGVTRSSMAVICQTNGPGEVMVPLNTAIGAGIHRVCTRLAAVNPTGMAIYPAPYEEDRNCRAIAVAE